MRAPSRRGRSSPDDDGSLCATSVDDGVETVSVLPTLFFRFCGVEFGIFRESPVACCS